jgi:hypothetical protein
MLEFATRFTVGACLLFLAWLALVFTCSVRSWMPNYLDGVGTATLIFATLGGVIATIFFIFAAGYAVFEAGKDVEPADDTPENSGTL